jgi:L-threonylcarbamoyladenylate synthase
MPFELVKIETNFTVLDLKANRLSFNYRSRMFNPRHTTVRQVSPVQPEAAAISQAATLLRRGGLVAFPTETVYGLGANALDAAAVESIFAAKGRPSHNPVIVHVADATAARQLSSHWSNQAALLAEKFWPGSLTLIVPKQSSIPNTVTAGGPTIGLRVPAHPVALSLMRAAQIPIAAPSANRSTEISPTLASHVLQGLNGRIDMLLDGGPTPGGLESTVLDLTVDPPCVLRPGLVTIDQLQAFIGHVAVTDRAATQSSKQPLRSPGMLDRHYAPKAKLICIAENNAHTAQELLETYGQLGWLQLPGSILQLRAAANVIKKIEMPQDAAAYAARLYAALHEMDEIGVDFIIVDSPPTGNDWLAIHDRLRRAAQTEK